MPRATLEKKPADVASMFDGIARRYDLTNEVISGGQARAWRRHTVRAVAPVPGERILDLAAGTGTSSVPFTAAGAEVVACDFSWGMLAEGHRRRPQLEFVAGDAMHLPFADATFDAVTISFGLRNVADTSAALAQMLRVTRPGGRIVIAEFSRPTWGPWRTVYTEYLMRALPVVAGAVTKEGDSYRYLAESIRSWPSQVELGKLMCRAGWSKVAYRNMTGGIVALHRGIRP